MSFIKEWIRKLLPSQCQRDSREAKHYPDSKKTMWHSFSRSGQSVQRRPRNAAPRGQGKVIDPLIVAHLNNTKKGALYDLPDEILLCILEQVGDDIVTLYYLRRVSRAFRRIIFEPRIWKRLRSGGRAEGFFEWYFLLSEGEARRIELRLRRDGMCDECGSWCKVLARGLFRILVKDQEPSK